MKLQQDIFRLANMFFWFWITFFLVLIFFASPRSPIRLSKLVVITILVMASLESIKLRVVAEVLRIVQRKVLVAKALVW